MRLLTWRRIDDLGAETGSPPLAKFNNERDNPRAIRPNIYHDFAVGARGNQPGLDSCLRARPEGRRTSSSGKPDHLGRNRANLVNAP